MSARRPRLRTSCSPRHRRRPGGGARPVINPSGIPGPDADPDDSEDGHAEETVHATGPTSPPSRARVGWESR
ncbi:hypothetical protein HBB16_13265 [Pseudonocardia sp. MCCB 268]|nr:hypothetical protein [Pseudonocardia cytotoxica]